MPTDYGNKDNWLAAPDNPAKNVDVFFAYPTAWRAEAGGCPVSRIDNPAMRHRANYYLATRASVFKSCANIFAPYYRQLDSAFAVSKGTEVERYFNGAPMEDVTNAFEYFMKNFNRGRPFILAGHSQGSIMLRGILSDYMGEHPAGRMRMIAAYAIGVPFTRGDYAKNPHLKPAESAEDVGVVISYNTEAPKVEGVNPFSSPDAVTINPVSWTTGSDKAPACGSRGSLIVQQDGTVEKAERLADAQINPERGTVICSTVAPGQFGSSGESAAYFPYGVLHENDIPLYYFDLRANAELRIRKYLMKRP